MTSKTKTDFKVGDTIMRQPKHSNGSFLYDPGPFKIVALSSNGEVTLDRIPDRAILRTAEGWYINFFEKVETPTVSGEFILIPKQGTKLKPSTTPRTYSTEAHAKAVAASMAEKYPGQEFLIFKAVGKAKAVAATVEMFGG